MRELKLRAWNKERRFMSDPFGVMEQPLTSNGKFIGLQLAEDLAIMLFTGLSDKNGKEIYEGDVLEKDDTRYPVEWNEKRYCFWLTGKPKGFSHYQTLVYAGQVARCKVIGNIYENPDLLK